MGRQPEVLGFGDHWNLAFQPYDKSRQPPDIIEFVTSPLWLDRPNLYPRQATLLKLIFIQDEFFCADEKTQILTRRGWTSYTDLIEGEDVMTLNHEQGVAEWQPALAVNIFPTNDAELISRESSGHSSLTTPNHRWPVERYMQDGGRFRWEKKFLETKDLKPNDRIPCGVRVGNLPTEPQWADAFVELVGWYWTEGNRIIGHAGIKISQSHIVNLEYRDRIRAALISLFGPSSPWLVNAHKPAWSDHDDEDMTIFCLNELASAEIKWAAESNEKMLRPEFLGSLTQDQLDLLINVSIMADGWVSSGGTRCITQANEERLASFQMACSLAGIRTNMRPQTVGGTGKYAGRAKWYMGLQERRPNVSMQRQIVKIVRHTGHVWCPTTANHTWLARREGKVYFTGNTDYDMEVIDEWRQGFILPSGRSGLQTMDDEGALSDVTTVRFQGDWGIPPDIFERIKMLKSRNYKWFTLVLQVLGRRSGKGYIGGLCAAYILWHYLYQPDVRAAYGIDKSKRLALQVFAGKKMQARDNQWRDIVNVIMEAPCFDNWISESLTDSLTVYSSSDRKVKKRGEDLNTTTMDLATFEIVPKEATTMAGRGPAAFAQFFDEMSHMINLSGGSRSAEEVWSSATPALDQFKQDAFRYCASSPWQMTGQFYTLCQQALEIDALTHVPVYPDSLICQLTSWDLYKDWEKTRTGVFPARYAFPKTSTWDTDENGKEIIILNPDLNPQINFIPLVGAIQEYDEAMQRLERANAETFRVERRSKWASILDAYFPTEHVRRMFAPYKGELLQQKRKASGGHEYVMHGDPGLTGSNFGFCVAHKEADPEGGMPHVVIDYVHGWKQGDFPNEYSLPGTAENEMDYIAIEAEILELVTNFLPSYISMDQWNSFGLLQRIARHARSVSYKSIMVTERTATAPLNWKTAETMKIALALNLVHSPIYDLLELECTFLRKLAGDKVDHPDTGSCTTKDVFDGVSACVYQLIGAEVSRAYGEEFSALSVHLGGQGSSLSGQGVVQRTPVGQTAQGFSNFTQENRIRRNSNPGPSRGGRRPR